jgi:type IX secretion system PorP/SprF family membrane protein
MAATIRVSYGQDPQYSQYYAAPLFLNPAMAGVELNERIGFNYRVQWPRIDAKFTTYSAYYDAHLPEINSGIGFHFMQDKETSSSELTSTTLSSIYSYELQLAKKVFFRTGFQASFMRKSLDFSSGQFFSNNINELNPFGIPNTPTDLSDLEDPVNLFSLSVGGILIADNLWIGASVFHLNQPNQSFFQDVNSALPMKINFHAGYRFSLGEGGFRSDFTTLSRERYFIPSLNYKKQGPFEQLDLGAYLYLEPIVFGMWYRGLPFKSISRVSNRDALVMMVGVNLLSGVNLGYSFDYTVSKIGIKSGGAQELSLSWTLPSRYQGKPLGRDTVLPCPKF